jgi:hypothetical protein
VIFKEEFVPEVYREKDGTWAYEVTEKDININDSIPHVDDKNYVLY